jgi:antitoxin HigA-1
MALRIERWIGRSRGGSAEVWLAQQTAYDLGHERQAMKRTKALATVRFAGRHGA